MKKLDMVINKVVLVEHYKEFKKRRTDVDFKINKIKSHFTRFPQNF